MSTWDVVGARYDIEMSTWGVVGTRYERRKA
jgi:hypothetical protein